MDPARHTGLAARQVDAFVRTVVEPIRRAYAADLAPPREPAV
jgi:hypothetical protein